MIEAKNVVKTFRGGALVHRGAVEAVRGVSLALEEGRTYALVGESGSGKTTLTHLLIGLLAPDSGSVTLDGRAIAAYPARERFRAVQLVMQDGKSALDPRVSVGRSIAEPMINLGICGKKEALRRAALLLRAVDMPEDSFHRKPAELSGGEQKRVCIARAQCAAPLHHFRRNHRRAGRCAPQAGAGSCARPSARAGIRDAVCHARSGGRALYGRYAVGDEGRRDCGYA